MSYDEKAVAELVKACQFPRYGDTATLMEKAADTLEARLVDGGHCIIAPKLRAAATRMRDALTRLDPPAAEGVPADTTHAPFDSDVDDGVPEPTPTPPPASAVAATRETAESVAKHLTWQMRAAKTWCDAHVAAEETIRIDRAAAEATIAELDQSLGNLLAIIHSDGGHYYQQHGHAKAVKDAHRVLDNLHATIAALRANLTNADNSVKVLSARLDPPAAKGVPRLCYPFSPNTCSDPKCPCRAEKAESPFAPTPPPASAVADGGEVSKQDLHDIHLREDSAAVAPPRETAESVAERIWPDLLNPDTAEGAMRTRKALIAALTPIVADRAAAEATIAELQKSEAAAHAHADEWKQVNKYQEKTIAELREERDLWKRSSGRYQDELTDANELIADLRESLGTAHRRAGDYEARLSALAAAKPVGGDREQSSSKVVKDSLSSAGSLIKQMRERVTTFPNGRPKADDFLAVVVVLEHLHTALREAKPAT